MMALILLPVPKHLSSLPKMGWCADKTLQTRLKCWAGSCVLYPSWYSTDVTYLSYCSIHHRKKSPHSTDGI